MTDASVTAVQVAAQSDGDAGPARFPTSRRLPLAENANRPRSVNVTDSGACRYFRWATVA
ncbi:hypothetical protein ACH46_09165 [Gordonia phthalatica]|uniref:Uncharacterized protein n=1 Tax=Gordonia phthalatica TaxID=1136941 RepID=A0A0N9NG12_9ACTN|nr:hypothetical protein ACH46_09165 [Gordonia phthalatica]